MIAGMSVELSMRRATTKLASLAAAAVTLIAPVAAQANGDLFMGLGPQVAPPKGFLDFCAREPGQCPQRQDQAAPAASTNQPNAEYWRLLFASLEPAASGRAKGQRQPGPRQTMAPVAGPAADQSDRQVVATSRKVLKQLKAVNRDVNGKIRSVSDREYYGTNDYWALALNGRSRFGDCEDYVLEKRRALKAQGYADDVLSIALVRTQWGQDHAVLIVSTSEGELVLDSLSPWISLWSETGYIWTARQSPLDPAVWLAGPAYFTAAPTAAG